MTHGSKAPNAFPEDDDLRLLQVLAADMLAAGHAAMTDEKAIRNAGNDPARAFRDAALRRVEELLQQHEHPVLLLHEGSPRRIGRGAPLGRLVIDPVDDPSALARGLPFSVHAAMTLAMAPAAGPLDSAAVRAALALPLMSCGAETALHMRRGEQAVMVHADESFPLQVTPARELREAAIGIVLTGYEPGKALSHVIGTAGEVLAFGGIGPALLALARGQLHACIDIRNHLTARHWLAAATLARAAGGTVMLLDDALEKTSAPGNLMQRRNIIAAASRELLEEILAALRRTWL